MTARFSLNQRKARSQTAPTILDNLRVIADNANVFSAICKHQSLPHPYEWCHGCLGTVLCLGEKGDRWQRLQKSWLPWANTTVWPRLELSDRMNVWSSATNRSRQSPFRKSASRSMTS